MAVPRFALCTLTCFLCSSFGILTGCNPPSISEASEDGYLTYENHQEKEQLLCGQPFHEAVASRNYKAAFRLLSDYAKQDVSRRQVSQNLSQAEKTQLAKEHRITELTLAMFEEWMMPFEKIHGAPVHINEMAVDEMDPEILAGRGNALDTMFSIGVISDVVPSNIRRSAIRSYITGRHTEKNTQYLMEREGLSEAEVHEYFEPQFEMKTVMVEIDGKLKVGYFEFLKSSD